jgi:outer membrane protein OmpA-like peptidoglycan-associated protein
MKQFCIPLMFAAAIPLLAQQTGPAPIYRVTVTERTVKAVNYEYRSGPTLIDFRGTVLMPKAKGEASVASKQGRCEIDAHFENISDSQRFGREYLTYVLWALTPDGRPHNIGEIVAGSSDKSHLRVTTDFQAFAMIVTAEPYSAVRTPSDVVVLENEVRPDTVGKIEQVEARYELMPRGHYSYQVPASMTNNAPKVSMRKYEELLEVYQAQNAVNVAQAAHAGELAPNTFAKAQQLLTEAQQLEHSNGDSSRVVQTARESAQTAEDARLIAERRAQDEALAKAQADVAAAQQAQKSAAAEIQQARAEAENARAQADAERAARERAEAEAAAARAAAQQTQAQARLNQEQQSTLPDHDVAQRRRGELRMQLLEKMNAPLPTRDTPRGLVSTLSGNWFEGPALRPAAIAQIQRLAAILTAFPGLRIEVEGHTAVPGTEPLSAERAAAVRDVLVARGVAPDAIVSRGFGNSRPIASNATTSGREQNQRVEVIVSGDPIGTVPFWDSTYRLNPHTGE